jgi:hypothetical protein
MLHVPWLLHLLLLTIPLALEPAQVHLTQAGQVLRLLHRSLTSPRLQGRQSIDKDSNGTERRGMHDTNSRVAARALRKAVHKMMLLCNSLLSARLQSYKHARRDMSLTQRSWGVT